MKYRMRIQYTETDKALMWERRRQGESLNKIARLFGRNHSAIGGILSRTGGMRPPPRCRSALALQLSEREEISRGVMAGLSVRAMARSLKRALLRHLRRTRGMRRSRHHTQKTPEHGRITETVSIRERPAEAEDRAVPGHWEDDLFFGSRNGRIATLVERQTRYVMLAAAVAAWLEREHQRPAAPVLPKRDGPGGY
jgi:IS30 family transposase